MSPLFGLAATSAAPPESAESPELRKLRRAAQDFEAMLLASWWQAMQGSWENPDEEGAAADTQTLQGVAMQGLASAEAASGGVGLAELIVRKLAPSLRTDGLSPLESVR